MFNCKEFGKRLKECRKAANLSQEKLSELSQVSIQTLSSYETGHSSPMLENIFNICLILNASLDYLVYGRSESRKLVNDEKIDDSKQFVKKSLNLLDTGLMKMDIQDNPFMPKKIIFPIYDEKMVVLFENIKKYVDDRDKLDPSTYRVLIDNILDSSNYHL